MIILSVRTKESIKTALAMTIAYGIALAMDWDRPYWAGFAVAFCSLGSVGQSLNQAAMRMLGTLVAMVVALIGIVGSYDGLLDVPALVSGGGLERPSASMSRHVQCTMR